MPEKGENAIYKAARALTRLEAFNFGVSENPVLGKPTLNVGIISGGININSVPDLTTIGVDIRPTPGLQTGEIEKRLGVWLGPDITIRCLEAFPGVLSDPDAPWIRDVFKVAAPYLETPPAPEGAPYFTDASFLVGPMGNPPTVLLGPGEPEQAHSTDEFCYLAKIKKAAEIYFEIARRWCLAEG
jgi:succinyl-diaminopimelate desuccinylase